MDKVKIKQDSAEIIDVACMPLESDGAQQPEAVTIILWFADTIYTLRAYLDESGKWVIGND